MTADQWVRPASSLLPFTLGTLRLCTPACVLTPPSDDNLSGTITSITAKSVPSWVGPGGALVYNTCCGPVAAIKDLFFCCQNVKRCQISLNPARFLVHSNIKRERLQVLFGDSRSGIKLTAAFTDGNYCTNHTTVQGREHSA